MSTINGTNWKIEYQVQGGKLRKMKFYGKAKDMRTAMNSLQRKITPNH